MGRVKDDAAALQAFAQSQQAIIERETFDPARDMADIVYPQYVPVVGGNPLAEAVTFISTKRAGAADFINANADDVPLVGANADANTKPVFTAAIGYAWGWEELRQASAMGWQLQADKAITARRAYEEMMQRLVFDGDSKRGLVGLNAAPGATKVTTGFTGDWSDNASITAKEIAKDLLTLIRGTGKGEEPTANRIVLPADEYTTAQVTFFGDSSQTALSLVASQYPGVQVTSRVALETAGTGSKRRYLAYRFDPTSLAFYLPMPLQFLPVYQAGPLRFEVPGVFRVAGLNVKRSTDFAYADGQ